MKRTLTALLLALFAVAGASAQSASVVTFGAITDTHVCDKPDQSNAIALTASPRYFTGGLAKLDAFSAAMNAAGADFVIELGDFTDNPVNGSLTADQRRKAALGFLEAAEARLAQFKGPRYHVLGNHDTDQASKADFYSKVTNTGTPGGSTYYSFDKGGVHFVVLDASFKADGSSYSGVPGQPGAGYSWDDANIPADEVAWLKSDLAGTRLAVIVFTHQEMSPLELVDAAFDPKHSVKNAVAVRGLLEASNKVLAVFSGHYHDGGFQEVNGIRYLVLQASAAYGNDASYHNQYATVKVVAEGRKYTVAVAGNGIQRSSTFTRSLE
jgi:3',5'-cyclic AMP phosphodiesterase CpdA